MIARTDNSPEPTLRDVLNYLVKMDERFQKSDKRADDFDKKLEAYEKRTDRLERRMDAFEQRMDAFDKRMDQFEKRMDREFTELHERMDKFERALRTIAKQQTFFLERFEELERNVRNIVLQLATLQDSLFDVTDAEAKDALATINHEGRIIRLEKLAKIKPETLKHLRGASI